MHSIMERKILVFCKDQKTLMELPMHNPGGIPFDELLGPRDRIMAMQRSFNEKNGTNYVFLNKLPQQDILKYLAEYQEREAMDESVSPPKKKTHPAKMVP